MPGLGLDALNAGLRKIQARLSATEDDDDLDALVADRKAIKARIERFEIVPDSYDYAPTGQTVSGMWNSADDTARWAMTRAVKNSWGLTLARHQDTWGIAIGTSYSDASPATGIVDLGNGLCFRHASTPA